MTGRDIFDLFRCLLVIFVATYLALRAANFIMQIQTAAESAGRRGTLMARYMWVQLLRARLRRFSWDLVQIAALLALLVYLLILHLQAAPA